MVIHAVYGGVYGKVNDVVDDHKQTGGLLPVLTHLARRPRAASHGTRLDGFGPDYKDSFFACLFNLHKVTRHVLEPSGATFRSRDSDFLTSDSTRLPPDGCPGGRRRQPTRGRHRRRYKLCCPTVTAREAGRPGAIYRVRRKGAIPIQDPRGLKVKWDQMKPADLVVGGTGRRTHGPPPASRVPSRKARRGCGAGANPAARFSPPVLTMCEARRNLGADPYCRGGGAKRSALGALRRFGKRPPSCGASPWPPGERSRVAGASRSSEGHIAAAPPCRSREARPHWRPTCRSDTSRDWEHVVDRFLEHSLINLLIEIADPKATAAGLEWRTRSPPWIRTTCARPDGNRGGSNSSRSRRTSCPAPQTSGKRLHADRHPPCIPMGRSALPDGFAPGSRWKGAK